MKRLDQRGLVDGWFIGFILTLILFLASAGFGVWAFSSRNDYKTNVDAKIAEAVEIAEKANSEKKDAEFKEKEKEPYRTYVGPAAYASVAITYPKTWSAYVDESAKGSNVIDAYFNPATVPSIQGSSFAVRMQVLNASYATQVKSFDQFIKSGKITSVPFRPEKVPSITGIRLTGEILTGKQGSMIVLPVRDKTLKIWAESNQFLGDLDKIVLPNLTFSP